jgi:Rha family phage regulatory protein
MNGGHYVDSRQVAGCIGKQHKNLIRDIERHIGFLRKSSRLNFEPADFFLESRYRDAKGEARRCYLLSKMGCELCAHRLAGEKGALFTAAYVSKFNALEAAERERETARRSAPRLGELNSAVRNVLSGMAYANAAPNRVMSFLRGVYEPLGVKVLAGSRAEIYRSASAIAAALGIHSKSGRPHGRAVAAIIGKLENTESHTIAVPYGLAGVSMRYDSDILEAVDGWIAERRCPRAVRHLDFDYHIRYGNFPACQTPAFDGGDAGAN